MRIGIIALNFQPGTIGGVETYFRNLLAQLQKFDSRNEYIVVLPEGQKAEIPITNSHFSILELPVRQDMVSKTSRLIAFPPTAGYRSKLARRIDALGCDLLHFPIQIMLPLGVRTPSVVSCMDIQQEYLPQFFSVKQLLVRRMSYKASLMRAKHIITISDYVKGTLQEKYRIDNAKITTVHLCVDERLFSGEPIQSLPKNNLPDIYFFYPAAVWPHKNHERLLQAFSLVVQQYPDVHLVLSGIAVQKKSRIERLINRFNLDRRVHILGYLKYDELASIYRQAYSLIFPSLYEGFGIPMIEAMHAGCPVICSRGTSLPEVAGKAAVYFNPLDVDDIARSAIDLLNNPHKRADLIAEGKRNALRFSGGKFAEETIAVYERHE
jgi:glycosyltransferase involved in cell wall biosynthesis